MANGDFSLDGIKCGASGSIVNRMLFTSAMKNDRADFMRFEVLTVVSDKIVAV
jgi:hypothetical protein